MENTRVPLAPLREIGKLLQVQDNRGTAEPIFLVQRKEREFGIAPGYTDTFVWVDSESLEEVDSETAAIIEATLGEGEEVDARYYRVGYRERWEYVTTCFTEQAANQFIEDNRHNLGDARVYVDSGWRNPEWKAVRSALLVLPDAELPAASAMRVLTQAGLRPVCTFDDVEVHAMQLLEGELCPASAGEEPWAEAYSVFLHLREGGVECVHDFGFDASDSGAADDAKEHAEMLAIQLRGMLAAVGTLRTADKG